MKASLDDAFLSPILNCIVLSRGNHVDNWFETKSHEEQTEIIKNGLKNRAQTKQKYRNELKQFEKERFDFHKQQAQAKRQKDLRRVSISRNQPRSQNQEIESEDEFDTPRSPSTSFQQHMNQRAENW